MRVLVLGAGAVGGYFGGRMAEKGMDVTFLVREQKKQQLRQNGLVIKSPKGDLSIQPNLITMNKVESTFDIILFTNKAYDLDEILQSTFPVKDGSIIIPLLNGYTHMEKLRNKFSNACVFGGIAHIFSTLSKEGEIHHFNDIHSLTFGHLHNADETDGRKFFDACISANFTIKYSDNITVDLWHKWILIATVAGATTLFNATIGEIASTEHGRSFINNLHGECINIAKSEKIEINADELTQQSHFLSDKQSTWNSSMRRDMLNNSKIECAHIFLELIKIADKNNVLCPSLKTVMINGEIYMRTLS
ncbi:ketopantoate reductase family protein [Paracoccaceae bacterium]|nr:ketopantoate reductase family protein [Paracoccaceae bacterium]